MGSVLEGSHLSTDEAPTVRGAVREGFLEERTPHTELERTDWGWKWGGTACVLAGRGGPILSVPVGGALWSRQA